MTIIENEILHGVLQLKGDRPTEQIKYIRLTIQGNWYYRRTGTLDVHHDWRSL